MKFRLIAIAATAALASGLGAASAADHQAMSKTSTPAAMQPMARDSLSLTRRQERTALRDISQKASGQSAPSSFNASVGATIPDDITIRQMPAKLTARVSSLKPYDYALLPDHLLIVNPKDKKVVDVINRRA
jgi:hypothetical protein